MRRFVLGLVAGSIVSGLLVAVLARWRLAGEFEHGRRLGELDGRPVAIEALRQEFGDVPSDTGGKRLFSLKTSDVVAVVVDGVKTVRVVP